jgi:hypothetical protein
MKRKQLTNKERSKLRQKLGITLNLWAQRVADLEYAKRIGVPEAAVKLDFCRQEHTKVQKALRELDRGVRLQRVWVRGTSNI